MNYYTQILKQASAEYKEMERIKAKHQRNMGRLLARAEDYIEKAHYFFVSKLKMQNIVLNDWVDVGIMCWLRESITRQSLNLPVWYEGRLCEGSWVQWLLLNGSLVSTPKSFEMLQKTIPGKYQNGQQALPEIEARFAPWEEWIEVVVETVPGEVVSQVGWVSRETRSGTWRKVKKLRFFQNPPTYRLRLTLKKAPTFKEGRKRR